MSQPSDPRVKHSEAIAPRYELDAKGVVWEIRGDLRRDIGTESEIFSAWKSLMMTRMGSEGTTSATLMPASA